MAKRLNAIERVIRKMDDDIAVLQLARQKLIDEVKSTERKLPAPRKVKTAVAT